MARVTRDKVQALMSDPRIQAFLDMVSWAEGTDKGDQQGYDILFGGGSTSDFSDHPNVTQNFYVKKQNTTAAGRYQTTNPTYQEFAKALGITDFSPESQDMVGIGLIIDAGAADDILNGNLAGAVEKLKRRWDAFTKRKLDDIYSVYNAALDTRSSGQAPPLSMTANPNTPKQTTPSFNAPATGGQYATPTIPGGINFTYPMGMDLPKAPGMPGPPPSDSNIQARIRAAMSTPRLAISTDQLSPETIANMEEALVSPRAGTPVVSFPTSQFASPTNVALVGNAAAGMPTVMQRPEAQQISPQAIQYYNGIPLVPSAAQAMQIGEDARDLATQSVLPVETAADVSRDIMTGAVTGGAITPEMLTAAMNWQQAGASLLEEPATQTLASEQQRADILNTVVRGKQISDWLANIQNQLLGINNSGINNPLGTQKWPNVLDADIVRALETTRVPPVGA